MLKGKGKSQPDAGLLRSAGIAQRYRPFGVARRQSVRLAFAVRPAVWCAPANLTGRQGRISDGGDLLFRKKDTADSAGRRQ